MQEENMAGICRHADVPQYYSRVTWEPQIQAEPVAVSTLPRRSGTESYSQVTALPIWGVLPSAFSLTSDGVS